MTHTASIAASVEPATRTGPVIRVEDLHKSFGPNKVLDGFSIDLQPRENLAVIGRSGSGKSVLIKCIIGLLQADAGMIEIFGQEISQLSSTAMNGLRAQVGFLFQSNALYDSMTVRENLEFPLRRHRAILGPGQLRDRVLDALEQVGLADTRDMLPSELSGGMSKRIALARALVLQPSIILYDEPTTGLDPVTAREISELIVRVRELYGTAALIITHDLRCVRISADRAVVLNDGRCHAEGTYRELEQSDDPLVQKFFT